MLQLYKMEDDPALQAVKGSVLTLALFFTWLQSRCPWATSQISPL